MSLSDVAREFARDVTVLLIEAREAVRDGTLLLCSVGGITGCWLLPSDMFGGVFMEVKRVFFSF